MKIGKGRNRQELFLVESVGEIKKQEGSKREGGFVMEECEMVQGEGVVMEGRAAGGVHL